MRYMCRLYPIAYISHPLKTTNVTEALMFSISYPMSSYMIINSKLFNRGVGDVEDDGVMDHI